MMEYDSLHSLYLPSVKQVEIPVVLELSVESLLLFAYECNLVLKQTDVCFVFERFR